MRKLLPLAALLLATACQVNDNAPADDNLSTADIPEGSDAGSATNDIPAAPPPPMDNTAAPAPAPASPPLSTPSDPNAIPASEKTPAAAKQVLDDYFAALATRQYRKAYRMWSGNGAATGMTEAEFAASFAKYKIYDGRAFKAGDTEGAAGSIYIEFPVTVTGILAKGGGFHLSGPMTLKRVNDVDGSTAEQRRWHISSSGLKPRP
jgi:hypothetical protein